MKLKMAENSLFAVLLRSPWWISAAVAFAFVALAHVFAPEQYRVVVALGGFPFVVIAMIALWRQLRAPSGAEAQGILDAAGRMGWADFSGALARGYARRGLQARPLKGEGADLLLERDGLPQAVVAAKRWKAARHGEESLQALEAAAAKQGVKGIYVALGELSPNAQRFAKARGIELVQASGLVQLLRGVELRAG